MRILFGINNDDTVKGIIDFYQEKYKEKLEYKNVYYFKQLVQELATGEYDRAVVLEELEKFPTNNFAQIDDYLFKNIDSMTDIFDSKKIIYIASDRRRLGDEFLTKLFNLGIYTCLTEQNRTKGKVSEGINSPYLKRDVKQYYDKVSGESVYKSAEVSEIEIQRIISYYKNQNGIADKYNEIFDRIATQYTNEQLKIIIKFLPYDVKQYLSFNNDKYKELNIDATVDVQTQPSEDTTKKSIIENDAKVIEIKREPQIIEKIVVKQVNSPAQVMTEVLEKEVVKSVYEVPKDYRKIVCFVGAPKAGTTFCINAIGTFLARNKVKTAIVDVTKKRDTYTIYTYDNEGKRNIAAESLRYASNGLNEPLIYDKLSVYTAMPGEDRKTYNASLAIDTIMQNNNVILIDTDFTTPPDYFRLCQEIYIVQDMDILNVSQVTMFLRELRERGVPFSKIRVIINKHVKCALTSKDILEGIATYTSYDLKMYDELFNSATIPYYILPFDQENYKKYIEMVFKYSNKFATFTDDFKDGLYKIINSIYPIAGIKSVSDRVTNNTNSSRGFASIFKKTPKISDMNTSNDGYEREIK
jgi:arsenate reductase-like glutaredoxin family protein